MLMPLATKQCPSQVRSEHPCAKEETHVSPGPTHRNVGVPQRLRPLPPLIPALHALFTNPVSTTPRSTYGKVGVPQRLLAASPDSCFAFSALQSLFTNPVSTTPGPTHRKVGVLQRLLAAEAARRVPEGELRDEVDGVW
jgi:hypothetical protein